MSTPRVYWLTTEFFPPETGGTGVIAARLTQGLGERNLPIQVITRQTLPHSAVREQIGRIQVRRIRPAGRMKGVGWRALPAMLGYIARLAFLLAAEAGKYDVVIISGMKTIPLAAVPVCRAFGKKCAIRIESPFEIVEPISSESLHLMNTFVGRRLSQLLQRAQAAALSGAHRIIAISDDITAVLLRVGCRQSSIVRIPNAIDLERFSPLPLEERALLRKRLGFSADKTLVLYAGRLSRAKGLMMLMQAWPPLLAADPSLLLVLVGSGRDSWDNCESDIAEFVRANQLDGHIAQVGHSDRVHEYLQAADLFVSPSDYEGFGLSIVEALACALPVVSTSVGIAPQVMRHGENGFLCPPKDAPAFRAALALALAQRDLWSQIGSLARDAVMQFGIAHVIDQYVALCNDLAR
jgi:glycosyltransferase involved in cell wall biosynthesis